jgi:hypothetical protein
MLLRLHFEWRRFAVAALSGEAAALGEGTADDGTTQRGHSAGYFGEPLGRLAAARCTEARY